LAFCTLESEMAKKIKARPAKRVKPAGKRGAPKATPPATQPSGNAGTAAGSATGLRVRMFRVGFGDFFLLTVPTTAGDKHILIDCGVHAKDLGTINDAVLQMAQECKSQLALVIVTHRHADHISGFGTCKDTFRKISVERVWMSWFEDPSNKTAKAFQSSLTGLATQVRTNLAARGTSAEDPSVRMVENITGTMSVAGQAGNQAALTVIHGGFANTPQYDYYKAGDTPTLPADLVTAGLTAQILGPPIDPNLVSQMTNKNQQYLSAAVPSDNAKVVPFATQYKGAAGDYKEALQLCDIDQLDSLIKSSDSETLAAKAAAADKTLNNQSLVVLFSFGGKNLLFAGDAQWGNWENFLYGGAYGTPGHTKLTDEAQTLLGKIDFYKVGHHGSANATPKDAVGAMRLGCVGMCSTQPGAYNQVPRGPLLSALGQRMKGQLARSDQIFAVIGGTKDKAPTSDAGQLPSDFTDPTGALYVDYKF
jgi:beta-lactamase superfamily II metal-dependent hydrolase